MKNTYASAGVDVHKGEAFVKRLKEMAHRQGHEHLWHGAGGYASVVPISDSQAVALTTDGVGTKLLVAAELGKFDTIGIDLVAMCANDLICVGAQPQAFLDYYATPKLIDKESDAIIKGIAAGCDQAGMLLVGGETAELPDLYQEKHFDLAGFAMGLVSKESLLTGGDIKAGDMVIGIASSGVHSNGFSLARRVLPKTRWSALLSPTHIYVRPALELLNNPALKGQIKGLVHITGGGWRNLFRLKAEVGFEINTPLSEPEIFAELEEQVDEAEMFRTFNMGMGLAIVADSNAQVTILDTFKKHKFSPQIIGTVTNEAGQLKIQRGHKDTVLSIAN